MGELLSLCQSRPELSLRRFARYAGVPYWRLRDFEKSSPARNKCSQERDALREQVKCTALKHPTYGYRFLYQELRAQGYATAVTTLERLEPEAKAVVGVLLDFFSLDRKQVL